MERQRTFDDAHGWGTREAQKKDRIRAIEEELIGMMGEMGEVANLIKKARLQVNAGKDASAVCAGIVPQLKEELIDTFIYMIRLFQITDTDVEAEYLRKLSINAVRFQDHANRKS